MPPGWVEDQKTIITGDELRSCVTEEASCDCLEMPLNLMSQTDVFWIGGALGYTNDPTKTVIFQEIKLPERRIMKTLF